VIYLYTGVPGAGKTLFCIEAVMAASQDKALGIRQVYYHGINELDPALGWVETDPRKWAELPSGCIVVIDEAQRIFPPRPQGALVPLFVSALETHRHRGLDLYLITQHPTLLDTHVRRLVGIHRHVMRLFGGKQANIHTFEGVNENPDKSRASGESVIRKYPVEIFAKYKSAEIHTGKRRVPKAMILLVLAPVLLVVLGVVTALYIKQRMDAPPSGKESAANQESKGEIRVDSRQVSVPAPGSKADIEKWFAMRTARAAWEPSSAPIYDEVAKPVRAPRLAGCIKSDSRCQCYTQQATAIEVEPSICASVVARGYFQATDDVPLDRGEPYDPRAEEKQKARPPEKAAPVAGTPPVGVVQPATAVEPQRVIGSVRRSR